MKQLISNILLFFLVSSAVGQYALKGIISNSDGVPISGASIYLEGSLLGLASDARGEYSMKIPVGDQTLVVQHLGYATKRIDLNIVNDQVMNIELSISPFLEDEFVVEATRVDEQSPFAHQNISSEELEKINLAQDMPILLNQTISAVTTSDAGAGVGYTGIRIRGSDATRINVTVNGVPINDAESHGVFWVNMPDFASTTNSVQIQRGVGTSSNGAGAFGASINLHTTDFDSNAFVEFNNSYGSFNTRRHNVVFNSGKVSKYLNFEGRLSYTGSDGYIDRSAADLRSYYFSGGYHRKKFMAKAVVFSGREITQQAWWGTPESRLDGNDEAMLIHAANNGYSEEQTQNLLSSGRTYNHYLYDNEVDNYGQDHYQLITGTQLTSRLYLNVTGHYTRGKGYFEQSKDNTEFSELGLVNPVVGLDTIAAADVIVRRWLDNHFYGGVYSLKYENKNLLVTLGGSYNEYIGDHYGEVIWSEYANNIDVREQYYFSESKKNDLSNYLKVEQNFGRFTLLGDLQYRYLDYRSAGIDNDQRPIIINEFYHFFNPKIGASWQVDYRNRIYLSAAQASREPVRSDFTDASAGNEPQPEFLTDVELGWEYRAEKLYVQSNAFGMYYQNQLVLTGEVNDVGSAIRTNVPESYRLGLELLANWRIYKGLYWQPNATISQNKIVEFEETIYDYTNGFDINLVSHKNTDIAFSPSIVGGSELGYKTEFGLRAAILTKFVGRQFLDNTSNLDRSIAPYWTNDVLLSYSVNAKHWKNLEISLLINNVLDEQYASNGYTYSYIFGSLITENFYYPQAGTNWLAGVKWRF